MSSFRAAIGCATLELPGLWRQPRGVVACRSRSPLALFRWDERALAGWLYLAVLIGVTGLTYGADVAGTGRRLDLEKLVLSVICGWLSGFCPALLVGGTMHVGFHPPVSATLVVGGLIVLLIGPAVVTAIDTDDSPGSDVGPD